LPRTAISRVGLTSVCTSSSTSTNEEQRLRARLVPPYREGTVLMVARRAAVVMTALAIIVGANCAAVAAASSPGAKTAPALDSSSRAHATVPGCKAIDVVLRSSTSAPGAPTQGDQSNYVQQRFRNVGATCVFAEPKQVRVGRIKGALTLVPITNSGRATSWVLKHGQVASIDLGAWWPVPGLGRPRNSCRSTISVVTRVEIPLSRSWLKISLPTTWHSVCTTSASLSINIDLS
jgi:hypothetical protein